MSFKLCNAFFTERCWYLYFGWLQLLDIWFLTHAPHYLHHVSTSKYIFLIILIVAILATMGQYSKSSVSEPVSPFE